MRKQATSIWLVSLPPHPGVTLATWSGQRASHRFRGFLRADGHRIVFLSGSNPLEVRKAAHHLAKRAKGRARKLA